ncbi:hypothetical protein ACFV9C_37300 [Kribbella sp. NPDC059898]|uniref:hypothetical protein n=1 Tax=Kribbella sp. NPDC059898 TaxID=3346995 RepID=UPI00364ED0C8
MERLIADSLTKHAADAPTDDHLLAGIHARLHRRRTHRALGAVVIAAAAVATAITASQGTTHPQPAQQTPSWRWESFKRVEVQVPATWTQYISGPAPCTFMANSAVPSIGRVNGWSASREYTCRTPVIPLAQRQPYLWFDDVQKPGIKRYDGGWTEETRAVGGVKVSVLTKDDALRRKILDSARPISGTDSYGCSPEQPADEPFTKPPAQFTSASLCEYWQGSLIAGSAVSAGSARELADRIPDPNEPVRPAPVPYGCQDPAPRVYILHLRAEGQTWSVRYSYNSCVNLVPRIIDFLPLGPHKQLEPADTFDPATPIVSLPR